MHHDENLLQLIIDDLAPTQQLLELLREESLALYGRDMPLLEEILARKQSLIVLLEQHGKNAARSSSALACPQTMTAWRSWPATLRSAINYWPRAKNSINCSPSARKPTCSTVSRSSFSKLRPPTSCVYFTAESLQRFTTLKVPPRAWSSQALAAKPDAGLQRGYPRRATYWQNACSCV